MPLLKLNEVKILNDLSSFNAVNTVVTIGTFDGLHLGHQKILQCLKTESEKRSGTSVVFTFTEHPRHVLGSDSSSLFLLSTTDEKIRLFGKSGTDILVMHPFTKEFSQLPSEDFIRNILVEKMKVKTLVTGYDHHFGKNREGGRQLLDRLASLYNFELVEVGPFQVDGINVSSTKIRNHLVEGRIAVANRMLGYDYSLTGIVTGGKKTGRKIGFPTANILVSDPLKLVPADGVYAVLVQLENMQYSAMLNIGIRPTVNDDAALKTIEVNIFDINRDIYNREITVFFKDRIRDEMKFPGIELLKEQLFRDMLSAKKILGEMDTDKPGFPVTDN